MPNVNMNTLHVGEVYSRHFLAQLWGYQDHNAIRKGIVTPAGDNKIIILITEEKPSHLPQYVDHFEGGRLLMDGENGHQNDRRLMNSAVNGDEIYLFFRKKERQPFTFYGRIYLVSCEEKQIEPSKFVFSTNRYEVDGLSSLAAETRAHGDEALYGEVEGALRVREHLTYERSSANRAKAIEIHGIICKVCGFDFNKFYGEDLARDYIEIHHIKSLAEGVQQVDPTTDLIPLCSNCHSIVHRRRDQVVTITELRKLVRNNR